MNGKRLSSLFLAAVTILAVLSPWRSVASPSAWPGVVSSNESGERATKDPGWEEWAKLPPEIRAKVDPRILAELRGEVTPAHLGSPDRAEFASGGDSERVRLGKTRFLVHLRTRADLKDVIKRRFPTRKEQREAVFDALIHTAQATQGPVKARLDERMRQGDVASYQPFYVFNGFAVEGGLDTIIELAKRDDVERIVANYPLAALWHSDRAPASAARGLGDLDPANWNIDLVDADRVWSEYGITGQGAVVGDIDTGVDYTHPALVGTYRGNLGGGVFDHNYNWFDPDGALYPNGDLGPSRTTAPFDLEDHGTHTMGTMVGNGGIPGTEVGMAPGARWVAVSLNQMYVWGDIADDIMAAKAFQWMLCPTDLSGALATADCARSPDVINNSWGSANPADDTFRPAIQALRAAGIAPVFSAGNPYAGSGSIGSPGSIPEAIAVGATDGDDYVTYFSGRGPSLYSGEQKPEFTAPGVNVKSTVPGGSYDFYSGTSMAAPHVAGLIALMVSADLQDGYRDLNVDELEAFMERTAADLGTSGPDDDYGYGRIDAYNAVRWALSAGDLRGTVRNAHTGAPIVEAAVTGAKVKSRDIFTTTTGATGQYSVTVPAGKYNIAVDAWGYNSATFASQMVITSVLSIADLVLTPLPVATLSGKVLSGTAPVGGALVCVEGAPSVCFTTAANGDYTLMLPVGRHRMAVKANGYRILHQDTSVASGGSTQDFAMTPAPTILLVDADTYGGWFRGWPVRSFLRWPLDQRNYLYDLWVVQYTTFNDTQVMADGSLGYGIPSASTLDSYDLVIWGHGVGGDWLLGSTVHMGADDELIEYLERGGRLIISGQDLGYEDDGTTFYDDYLRADHVMDVASGEGETISGVDFLDGLNLQVTNASLHGYANGASLLSPDAVMPQDGASFPIMTYDNGNGTAALAIAPCDASYRAVYFALGYENIAPRADMRDSAIAEVLERSVEWVMGTRTEYGVSVNAVPARRTGAPGSTVTYDLQILNKGATVTAFDVGLSGNAWNTRILSGTATLATPVEIPPCGSQDLTLAVDIPDTAHAGDRDTVTVTASRSQAGTPSASTDVTTVAFPAWHIEVPMPTARYRLSAANLPGDIYIYAIGGFGGLDWNQPLDVNERYNACVRQWEVMAPMPTARANAGAAVIDGKIYVPGGYASGYPLDVLEIYDPAVDAWSHGASMPESLSGAAVAAYGGKLYTFGGSGASGASNRTYEYDPLADAWVEKAFMPGSGRSHAVAAELGGKIYVVGGWPSENTVQVYDPAADSWSTASSMAFGRQSPGLVAAPDGHLYVSGGGHGWWSGLNSAERYDPVADTWEIISSLNNADRIGSASAYAGGRIFAVGGLGFNLSNLNESLRLHDTFCDSGKTSWQGTVRPAGRITYTVAVYADPVRPLDASVVDPIAAGTTFAGFGVNPIGATYNGARDQVEWSGTLSAGNAPLTFTFGVDVDPLGWANGDLIVNTAAFDGGADLVFDRTAVTTLGIPDPSPSTKHVDKRQARAGDVLTYTLHIENASSTRDVITLRDPIPSDATYVPGSLTYTLGTGSYDAVDHAIHWRGTLPDLDAYVNASDEYEWGDSDGDGSVPDVTFDWIDILATGYNAGSGDDRYYCGLPIGFPFPFYGVEETAFCASTNGFVSFDTDGYADLGNECPLPSFSDNAALIAAIWDDLVIEEGIYYQTFGVTPSRYTVVQWGGVRHFGGSTYFDFEIILYENGAIKVQMLDAGPETGSGSTTGIEDYTETRGVSYACDAAGSLHDGLAILFLPPGSAWGAATAEVTFAVATATSLPIDAWITNTATISTSLNRVERSAGTLINPVDLSASTKTADKAQAVVDEVVIYSFALKNRGLVTATGAILNDPIPPNTVYAPGTVSCSSGDCRYDPAGTAITWSGDIGPGGTVTLTFAVTLATVREDMTPITNTATLDSGHGDRYDLEATFMARLHDLSSSFKEVDPVWVKPGGTVTYTVYVYNSGVAQAAAEMRDELPPDLTYVSESLVCGTGSCGYASGVITWTGVVYPRSMVPVRFLATVGTEVGRITNTAVVTDLVWNVGYPEAASVGIARRIYLPVIMQRGSSGYDWGDSDGRGSLPGVTFEWVDISSTGALVFLGDDDYVGPISVGFSFDFYGNAYSELYASGNGFLSFEAGSWEYGNEPITSTTSPNNIIALMWDDLDPGDDGDPLYYEHFAACPIGDRACLVVQYDGYHHYPGDGGNVAGTFEAVLFEGGDILIQFLDAGDEAGAGSTTGIENSDGTQGIEYAYDTAILHDGLAILFRPSRGSLW